MFTVLGAIWHLHVETRKEPESIIGHILARVVT